MPIHASKVTKWSLRLSVLLLLAACSQSMLETYGCPCAERTYTKEEIAGYRGGAARGDLNAMAEMQEYHGWRAGEYDPGSPEYAQEAAMGESFRQRRIALRDPEAIRDEVIGLLIDSASDELPKSTQMENLQRAQVLSEFLTGDGLVMPDLKRDDRRDILTRDYISRELAALRTG